MKWFGAISLNLELKINMLIWSIKTDGQKRITLRRRRVFILGYKKGSKLYSKVRKAETLGWLTKSGITAKAFPVKSHGKLKLGMLPYSIEDALQNFSNKDAVFDKAGLMLDGVYCTYKVTPDFKGKYTTLGDILLDENQIPESYFISEQDLPK